MARVDACPPSRLPVLKDGRNSTGCYFLSPSLSSSSSPLPTVLSAFSPISTPGDYYYPPSSHSPSRSTGESPSSSAHANPDAYESYDASYTSPGQSGRTVIPPIRSYLSSSPSSASPSSAPTNHDAPDAHGRAHRQGSYGYTPSAYGNYWASIGMAHSATIPSFEPERLQEKACAREERGMHHHRGMTIEYMAERDRELREREREERDRASHLGLPLAHRHSSSHHPQARHQGQYYPSHPSRALSGLPSDVYPISIQSSVGRDDRHLAGYRFTFPAAGLSGHYDKHSPAGNHSTSASNGHQKYQSYSYPYAGGDMRSQVPHLDTSANTVPAGSVTLAARTRSPLPAARSVLPQARRATASSSSLYDAPDPSNPREAYGTPPMGSIVPPSVPYPNLRGFHSPSPIYQSPSPSGVPSLQKRRSHTIPAGSERVMKKRQRIDEAELTEARFHGELDRPKDCLRDARICSWPYFCSRPAQRPKNCLRDAQDRAGKYEENDLKVEEQRRIDELETHLEQLYLEDPSDTRRRTRELSEELSKLCGKLGRLPTSYVIEVDSDWIATGPHSHGGQSDVYQASYAGRLVAIKEHRWHVGDREMMKKAFCQEVVYWKRLRHPNIVPFLGISSSARFFFAMVSEWMENGDIIGYLEAKPSSNRLKMLVDVMTAIAYMHHMKVIHGDIKGRNVLINCHGEACLTDFGLAAAGYNTQSLIEVHMTASVSLGTIPWSAPERLKQTEDSHDGRPTARGDIYSFGILMWEVYTLQTPFGGCKLVFPLMNKIIDGLRPDRTSSIPDTIWGLMCQCWAADPKARPRSHALSASLSELLN